MALRLSSKTKGVSTLDIWPWKYLVLWMSESATMFANVVSAQVISQLNEPNTSVETIDKTG